MDADIKLPDKAEKYKKYVEDNKLDKLIAEISKDNLKTLLMIIAFKTADQNDKARRLIDFIRAEIENRNIQSSSSLNSQIRWATWIVAISTGLNLAYNILK